MSMKNSQKPQRLETELEIANAAFEQLALVAKQTNVQISDLQAFSGIQKVFDDFQLQLKPMIGKLASLQPIMGPPASLQAEVIRSFDRAGLLSLKDKMQDLYPEGGTEGPILFTRFVPLGLAEQLREIGVNFADSVGNVSVLMPERGINLYVRKTDTNPYREVGRPLKNLSGEASALVIRGIADLGTPIKVSELIDQTGVSRASAYRTLDYCQSAGYLTRSAPGVVETVELSQLLEDLSESFGFTKSGNTTAYISKRGLEATLEKLKTAKTNYALTGTYAAHGLRQIAQPMALVIYSDDKESLATELGLREVESGGDVFINTPDWKVVYQRPRQIQSITTVSAAQIAIDLLGGPGRNPEEGRALVDWLGRAIADK